MTNNNNNNIVSSHSRIIFLWKKFTLILIIALAVDHPMQMMMSTTEAAAASLENINRKPSAIFVFGDSTVDAGNNNFIPTLFKSNFPPYGRDFDFHLPTGRFTNGKLVTDHIASYVGIKELVPPYLDPMLSLEDLLTGVCFASAGTGYDPLTAQLDSVISMEKQLEYLREYKGRIEKVIGKKETQDLIGNAIFVISCGTNDFVVNYFGFPIRQKYFSLDSYQQFLIQQLHLFLKELWLAGAKKIVVVGLPPMGCLPSVISLHSIDPFSEHRECIDMYSSAAQSYNFLLQKMLKASNLQNHDGRIVSYVDIYTPLNNIIQSHNKFGIEVADRGCCGTGLIEASVLCNSKTPTCPDATKYAFWDGIHPTDRSYYLIFQSLIPTIDAILQSTN
ncbi:GDSL esterase/lipase At5g45960-like [Impatiens glandulifera]|uniref:GDSL esterase/lipase At5g45960-like n=1 Tax=Impatiens glandulifera TaxID=253017 RepID=UPI001FB0EEEC|nr:GDSL esterase/lipase At5g45960-like [Impatiens glandulifera]